MKKIFYFSALVCTAIAFTACSSSKESAYRKAYEKAKAQEQQYAQPAQQEYQAPVQQQAPVTPMVQQPVQQTTTVVDKIAFNSERNMYRVIATTHDDRSSAVSTKESLKATYPDAWLLMK